MQANTKNFPSIFFSDSKETLSSFFLIFLILFFPSFCFLPHEKNSFSSFFLILIFQAVKILFPHFALIVLLLSYTAFGAYILQLMEFDVQMDFRKEKLQALRLAYQTLANESWQLKEKPGLTRDQWTVFVRQKLSEITTIHEGSFFSMNETDIETRWTFPTAVLYVLTLLTTCGKSSSFK